jgi:hypothetical protein
MVGAGLWAGVWVASAWGEPSIYTCIDAKGRRLTSDRPILECIDREQQELSPSGKVIRKIGPSLTAEEQRQQEEQRRKDLEERERQPEEKRRDRALVTRYPDRETHDRERQKALTLVDEVIATAKRRLSELHWQRKTLDNELEFYGNDMGKAPLSLKRRYDDNDHAIAAQNRFIADQEDEKRRINANFDDELTRLTKLWQMPGVVVPGTPTAAASAVPAAAATSRSSASRARLPAAGSPSRATPSSPAPRGR